MRERALWTAIFVSLGVALALCEWALQKADDDAHSAHEARWNCLAEQNHRLAACRPGLALPMEDMDYCPEAVQACKKKHFYQVVERADKESAAWYPRRGFVIAAMLVATLVLVLRFAGLQLMRWRRSRARDRLP